MAVEEVGCKPIGEGVQIYDLDGQKILCATPPQAIVNIRLFYTAKCFRVIIYHDLSDQRS